MNNIGKLMARKLSSQRYRHSVGVAELAMKLAIGNQVSAGAAYVAGMVHDYARELPGEQLVDLAHKLGIAEDEISLAHPELLHAPVGAHLIKEDLGICDQEIIQAVASHTLGRRKMTKLEQIIYLADMIEPTRKFPGVEQLRNKAQSSLREGILGALDHTIQYLLEKGKPIHIRTVEARNYLIWEGIVFD